MSGSEKTFFHSLNPVHKLILSSFLPHTKWRRYRNAKEKHNCTSLLYRRWILSSDCFMIKWVWPDAPHSLLTTDLRGGVWLNFVLFVTFFHISTLTSSVLLSTLCRASLTLLSLGMSGNRPVTTGHHGKAVTFNIVTALKTMWIYIFRAVEDHPSPSVALLLLLFRYLIFACFRWWSCEDCEIMRMW